jgi:uncharacterized C2H2 Zn-finger protein
MSDKRKLEDECPGDRDESKPKLRCEQCGSVFVRRSHLTSHILSHSTVIKCGSCKKQFRRKDNLLRHKREMHPGEDSLTTEEWACIHCGRMFSNYTQLFQHVTASHPLDQHGGRVLDEGSGDNIPADRNPENFNDSKTSKPMDDFTSVRESALNNVVLDHIIYPSHSEK